MLVHEEDDGNSSQDEKVADASEGSYGVGMNWYVDSGTIGHITIGLEKVTKKENYCGQDQIHTTSGAGMRIQHVGQSVMWSAVEWSGLARVWFEEDEDKYMWG